MTVLELAERLGNASEACRRAGMDRTSFFDRKRRFDLDGLKDRPPIHRSHPQTTPLEVVERIVELALKHPAYGCIKYEALLALEGRRVSAITLQKILNDMELGNRQQRWPALEKQNADQVIELTPGQAKFLDKLNPCFRERHIESNRPGELLSADTLMVGTLKGLGRVYLHAVVDTYAFGFLHVSKQPEAPVAVLHNDVLPFYEELDLPIKAVLTDNRRAYGDRSNSGRERGQQTAEGRDLCGTERHPYELYLALNDIEHRKTKVGSPKTNGRPRPSGLSPFGSGLEGLLTFERRALQRHRPRGVLQAEDSQDLYGTVEALQAGLHAWLHHYNQERPHLSYRNQGRRPWEMVQRSVTQEG